MIVVGVGWVKPAFSIQHRHSKLSISMLKSQSVSVPICKVTSERHLPPFTRLNFEVTRIQCCMVHA